MRLRKAGIASSIRECDKYLEKRVGASSSLFDGAGSSLQFSYAGQVRHFLKIASLASGDLLLPKLSNPTAGIDS